MDVKKWVRGFDGLKKAEHSVTISRNIPDFELVGPVILSRKRSQLSWEPLITSICVSLQRDNVENFSGNTPIKNIK